MRRSIFNLSAIYVPVFIVGLVAGTHAFADSERQHIISVNGVGTASVAPDMAIVSVGVLREAKTAREALTANNKAMADVLAQMKKFGIEDKDLQTSNFNIQPKYVYPKRQANGVQNPPKIVGYTVGNTLTIRIRDLKITGDVLDKVVTLGVNTGGGIQFTNSDTSEILRKARIAAVKNAREKAEAIVGELDIELGKVTHISEGSHQPRPMPIAKARMMAADAVAESVPVAAGENSYRVTVNISWELDQ